MPNYKPVAIAMTSASVGSATTINKDITNTSWGLAFIDGRALFSNTVMKSGTVIVWESTTESGTPRTTFTDSTGYYGVTVTANRPLTLKAYS